MQQHIVKSFDEQINTLKEKIKLTSEACGKQLAGSSEAVQQFDTELAKAVIAKDDDINRLQREIEEESVRIIALRQPMATDLRFLLACMKIASELERIADYAANISKRVGELKQTPDKEPVGIIVEMIGLCSGMLNEVIDAFLTSQVDKAAAVWHKDDDVDRKFARMMTLLRNWTQDGGKGVEDITQLMFMGRCCERIGDHITNIAEDTYYMATGRNYIDILEER